MASLILTPRRRIISHFLYHTLARYYSPTLQRFLSEDPLQFGGGQVDLFTYAQNNPVNLSDPSGMQVAVPGGFVEGYCAYGFYGDAGLGGTALTAALGAALNSIGSLAEALGVSPAAAAAAFGYAMAFGPNMTTPSVQTGFGAMQTGIGGLAMGGAAPTAGIRGAGIRQIVMSQGAPKGPLPVPVPGDPSNEWKWNPNPGNSRGGTWGPKTPIQGQSQPSGSWDPEGHWDIDNGKGKR